MKILIVLKLQAQHMMNMPRINMTRYLAITMYRRMKICPNKIKFQTVSKNPEEPKMAYDEEDMSDIVISSANTFIPQACRHAIFFVKVHTIPLFCPISRPIPTRSLSIMENTGINR